VHVEVLLGIVLLGLAYAWAWVAHDGRPEAPCFACFFAGLVALALALNGPLHDLSDFYLFSAHMVQHLVLTLAVPPLLLLGIPTWMADRMLAPLLGRGPTRWVVRTVTRPVPALAAYTAALVLWHLPVAHELALRVHAWHVVQHLSLMAAAMVAWWPILTPSALVPRLHYGAQVLYVFALGMPMTVVAAMITGAEELLYPSYATAPRLFDLTPFADQRLGGVIMWVPAGLVPLLAFTAIFFRWAASEADEDNGGSEPPLPPIAPHRFGDGGIARAEPAPERGDDAGAHPLTGLSTPSGWDEGRRLVDLDTRRRHALRKGSAMMPAHG
jgi:putative membrane protein